MANKWPEKDPDDILDYSLTWADQMEIDGDTIADYQASVLEEGDVGAVEVMTTPGHQISFDPEVTIVWLSGGVAGNTYNILNRIITTSGRQYDHTRTLKIKEH